MTIDHFFLTDMSNIFKYILYIHTLNVCILNKLVFLMLFLCIFTFDYLST